MLQKAWEAQAPGSPYDDQEQLEILAFAYGFLTHAAGDMWAHTLVNDLSQGVFPPVAEIASDPEKAKIAFRHIIIEGYVGDATPGFDGNPDRTEVPGELNNDDDPQISDDETHAIAYETPPDDFLWEVFVGRQADAQGHMTQALPGQPTAARGALIEFFYDLRDDLYDDASTFTSVDDAINSLKATITEWDRILRVCNPDHDVFDIIECGTELIDKAFSVLEGLRAAAIDSAIEVVVDAYKRAWIADIDEGLRNWSNVGHAFTKGLFDPHARRVYQDEECGQTLGVTEGSAQRIACEDGIGQIGTFLDVLGESLTTQDPALLSMLGLPDAALFAVELADELTDPFDEIFPGVAFVAEEIKAHLRKKLEDAVKGMIKETTGVDVAQLQALLKNPASFLDAALPAPPFPPGILLFNLGDHERLDRIIGFEGAGPLGGHHTSGNRLEDDEEFVAANFAPLQNTIVTSKLLLLAGGEVDRALGDILDREVDTYSDEVTHNIMIDSLGENDTPWLRSIDSDHAWRQDGLPVFCDEGTDCDLARDSQPHYTRPKALRAGTGRMPIWESCVLRPAFGQLFTDWENGSQQWPALGDGVSADPSSDNWAPRSYLDRSGGVLRHTERTEVRRRRQRLHDHRDVTTSCRLGRSRTASSASAIGSRAQPARSATGSRLRRGRSSA